MKSALVHGNHRGFTRWAAGCVVVGSALLGPAVQAQASGSAVTAATAAACPALLLHRYFRGKVAGYGYGIYFTCSAIKHHGSYRFRRIGL